MFFAYIRKLGLDFQLETDASLDRQFKEKAAQLIAIEDIPALSKLTFKHAAQQSGYKSALYCNKVTGSLKNLSGRKLRGVDVENILITFKKDAWIKATNDNQLKLGHFSKDFCLC